MFIRYLNILVILILDIYSFKKKTELEFNPYKHFDKKEHDWNTITISKRTQNVFMSRKTCKYPIFKKRNYYVTLGDSFNWPANYRSKLAFRLFHFLTDGYEPKPFHNRNFKLESPFIIDKK